MNLMNRIPATLASLLLASLAASAAVPAAAQNGTTQLLPALDTFVLSSVSEGISLALLEAMAAGVPVVATRVGGNLEILHRPGCGILVPPRAPRELAGAILALMNDPNQRRELSAGGRRRVEEAFSLQRMIGAYEALYASLVN